RASAAAAGARFLRLNHAERRSLLGSDLTAAVAFGAGFLRGARRRAAAVALVADFNPAELHFALAAFRRLFKRDGHACLRVAAARGGVGIAAAAAEPAESAAENIAENIAEVKINALPVKAAAVTGAARPVVRVHARVAEAVIFRLFLRVGQNLI